MGSISGSLPLTLDPRGECLYWVRVIQGLRKREQEPETCPLITNGKSLHSEKRVCCASLLDFCIHISSNLETNQFRHRRDLLWPGMTWNGMLKYVHRSKYSPGVSWLQPSSYFSTALLSGFIWHLLSFPEQKRKIERARWGVGMLGQPWMLL